MHSGGGTGSVVSVAPATPIIKHMIGIAALVLEGRDRGNGVGGDILSNSIASSKSKDNSIGVGGGTATSVINHAATAASGASNALYTPLDATTTTNSTTASLMTTSNWARAQNNRLAHIYRLKNRLLVESTGQSNNGSNRSSPVPDCDGEEQDGSAGVAMGGIFDPAQYLNCARSCRLTTPRSFLNQQMVEKRQTSSSSSSSAGSSGVTPTTTVAVPGRRNSRSSPVPVITMTTTTTRTHCDEFLRTIGLLKGAGGGNSPGAAAAVPMAATAVNRSCSPLPVVEDESHFCDEVVSAECFRWQQFLRKIETLLCRGSAICIEVSLGPEAHPLLLEQWTIQRLERPTQPSMTVQSLCSAIRSQLHFSQISAWSDLLEQQYTDYAFYQEHILKNPRITMNWGSNRPALDLLYRVKCATQKGTFERPPVVHNFPNVVLDVNTGLAVSLRSLPRLERIPRLSVENKKSDMMEVTVVESEILPSPALMVAGVVGQVAGGGGCCQEKGKHRCLTFDEMQQQQQQQQQRRGRRGRRGDEKEEASSSQQMMVVMMATEMGSSSCSTGSGGSGSGSSCGAGLLSHREKQLLKYKKRLLKRDNRHGKEVVGIEPPSVILEANKMAALEPQVEATTATTSINDLQLPPLYTDVVEGEGGGVTFLGTTTPRTAAIDVPMSSQDVATQTDLQLSIDDQLVEMEMEVDEENEGENEGEEDDEGMIIDSQPFLPTSDVSCTSCNNKLRLVCCSQSCDTVTSARGRFQRLRDKYRNAMVAKKAASAAAAAAATTSRVFYKKSLWNDLRANSVVKSLVKDHNGQRRDGEEGEDNNNVVSAVNRNVKEEKFDNVSRETYTKHPQQSSIKRGNLQLVTEFTSLCDYSEVERKAAESPSLFIRGEVGAKLQKVAQGGYHTPTTTNGATSCGNVEKNGQENGSMKLSKLDHETVSLRNASEPTAVVVSSTTTPCSQMLLKTSVHCVKNLTSIFTNATEAAAAALVKPPTPQVILKRLNLYTAAVAAQQQQNEDVFNFDLSKKEEEEEEEEIDPPRQPFAIKKSFSTPSASVSCEPPPADGVTSKTPNSLSPRFLKSASAYNKKQKRRSRHLSDRSSERSSVCSDELSLSDDETLLLTPNGSSLLLTTSPVLPTRRPFGGVAGGGAGAGVKGLFKSAFGHRPLLGSIEESLLQRRLTPKYLVSGFRVLLGASGGFCPKQLTIPAKSYFYELSGQSQTTPYLCEVRLPRKGYTVPRHGTVQVTLLNPLGTFVHMFVVAYDFREMPPMATTFIRQRSLMVETEEGKQSVVAAVSLNGGESRSSEAQMRLLRYVIHLRFQTTRSGRLVLHSDIRMLVNRRTDHDTAAAHAKGALESPNELRTITIMPENPRFSDRIDLKV